MAFYKDIDSKDFNKIILDTETVKTSVANLLSINNHVILGAPELGANLTRYLFEQLDFITIHQIKENVTYLLYNYEPRINNITINVVQQDNTLYIQVRYNIKELKMNDTVNIKLG